MHWTIRICGRIRFSSRENSSLGALSLPALRCRISFIRPPSPGGLSVAWDIKTGRAVNTQDPGNLAQKERTLKNMSPNTLYEYIQVYEK